MTKKEIRNIAFYTFGCKLNFSETSFIANKLRNTGYQVVPFNQPADYYIINNCTVTREAEKKFERLVRSVKSKNPDSRIIAMGCYSEVSATDLSMNPLIDLVLGTNQKFKLAEYIEALDSGRIMPNEHAFAGNKNEFINSYSKNDRTRSFLKIQDGCDYFCSYCAIPLARGRSRSDTIENILTSVKEIISSGVKEIVLTGVNVGEYKSPEGENLLQLLTQIDAIEDAVRIRISSLEPNLINNRLLELIAVSEKFMPHFHLPLQSGSNRILKMMKRKYTSELFTDQVKKIIDTIPDVFLGIDVITGFPGETDEDFESTFDLLSSLDIAYIHVFPYSERPGTKASLIKEKTPSMIISQRTHELLDLSKIKNKAFNKRYIGKLREVLFEGAKKDGFYYGHTDNYLKVRVLSGSNISNNLRNVKFIGLISDGILQGELVN
jgi:threonylcarbamoyladenosine tRNA methylthiotransferase MtaB